MNLTPVTDPNLLQQLEMPAAPALQPVTDPALLERLNTQPQSGFLPSLKVGMQATGRAVADIAGAPADLAVGALNAGAGLVNSTAIPAAEYLGGWLTGEDVNIPRIPRTPENPLGSESIANTSSAVADAFGADTLERDEMTDFQQLGYDVDRYATQAGLSGATMAKTAAGKAMTEVPALLRPYVGPGAGRTVAGDVAGGVGTGVAMNQMEEILPEEMKGPLTALLAALAGGVGGNTALNVAEGLTKGNWSRFTDFLSAGKEFQDPTTGERPSRRTVNQAAEHLQQSATDKGKSLAALEDTTRFQNEAGGTTPTIGMATDDVGLRYLEKAAALQNGPEFAARYEGVARDAANDVGKMQVEGADLEAPGRLAKGTIGKQLADAEGNVAAQEGQLGMTMRQAGEDLNLANQAETDLGNAYRPYGGGGDAASADLDRAVVDQTLNPMTALKNELYNNIDPDGNVMVPADELIRALDEIEGRASSLPPSMRGDRVPPVTDDLRQMTEETGTVPFSTLNEMRPVLSARESQARANKQFPLADSYREIKNVSGRAAEDLAAQGGPEGQRAMEANRNYTEEFAPLFNQGEGGKLRKDINRDDRARTNTPPTKTASRFLKEGPGGQEAAADLQRILAASPAGAEGQAAARRYVLSDLAKLVGADGRINETSLQKWINNRQGMLSQIPDINTEVNNLLRDVRTGASGTAATKAGGQQSVSRIQGDLAEARKLLAKTKSDVDQSALSIYLGKDPQHAVAAVFNSGDPVGKIKELRAAFAGDAAAEKGFRAAAAEHLTRSVTNADGEAVSYAKLAQRFKKDEAALSEVFGDDMKYLRQAQKRLEMLSRKNVQAVAGSGTIENKGLIQKAFKPLEIYFRMRYGALQGGSMVRKYKLGAEQLPDPTKAANELITRAIFDPEVAKHLLMTDVKVSAPAWNAKLNRLMGYAAASRESAKDVPEDDGEERK